ncbi:putative transposase-associated domain-containing protein [Tanacetum coccineum]
MNHIPPETTSSCHPSPQQLPRHLTTNPVTHKQLSSRHAPRKFACHYHRHRPTTFRHPLHKVEEVQYHLYRHGIDISYTKWTKHGEEDEPSISAPKPVNATTEFVDDMDFAYIPTDGPATVEMVNATKDNFDVDDLVKFQELLLDTEKPLYEGCPDFTKLSAIVKLLNLKGKYGASDKFFTELLGLIKKMLPAGNEMVEKTYQAKKVMRLIGSGYKKIHVCINNCLLYWKNDKDLTACRTCGTSRWKVDNKTKKVYENIPAKVMWYFPILLRLQRLFKIESISEDLRWHATRRITDGVLRHPADSQAWRTIDGKFLEITEDKRNLRLGILADGVDVNMGNRHHKPLVDDLHTLFETGVDTYDASTKDNFNLRAVVLWTINDYPALGTLCGCPYSGFKGYVVCGKDTNCVRLSASSKQSYVGHRRYLPYNHPFRKKKKAFNGQQEFIQAPIPMTGEQIYNEVKHIENKWGKGKRTNNNASENQEDTRGRGGKIQKQKRNTTEEEGSSSQVNGQNGVYWKKFNIWYRKLKYWRHNPVPHCIDFMHVEKNVAKSIVGTLLHVLGKTKDGLNARLDLAELGVKPELFAMQDKDKTTLPPSGYTLTNAGKDIFCETLHNIKVYLSYEMFMMGKVTLTVRLVLRHIDLPYPKEVATTDKQLLMVVYQENMVLEYTVQANSSFQMGDWVNHKSGGVKRDKLGYTLVDLNNLGHTVDPLDKKLSIVFKTPPKNYKDTYDKVDEEFSTVIHHRNDNVLPLVDRRDLANESRDDYYRKDYGGVVIRKSK